MKTKNQPVFQIWTQGLKIMTILVSYHRSARGFGTERAGRCGSTHLEHGCHELRRTLFKFFPESGYKRAGSIETKMPLLGEEEGEWSVLLDRNYAERGCILTRQTKISNDSEMRGCAQETRCLLLCGNRKGPGSWEERRGRGSKKKKGWFQDLVDDDKLTSLRNQNR